jgi:hypothetical protein
MKITPEILAECRPGKSKGEDILYYHKPGCKQIQRYKIKDCLGCHEQFLAQRKMKKGVPDYSNYCCVDCRNEHFKWSEEHKQKIASWLHTPEARQKVKETIANRTDEERAALSALLSASQRGVKKSPEGRENIRRGNTGKRHSEETKEKLSQIVRLPPGEAAAHALFIIYRHAAVERGIEFCLDEANEFRVLTKQDCFFCGLPPSSEHRTIHYEKCGSYIYNGIDRLDNTRGYVAGNMVACCQVCNQAKSQQTVDEFIAWVRKIAVFNPAGDVVLVQTEDPRTRDAALVRQLYRAYKAGATRRGLPFDIDLDTLNKFTTYQCTYCGDAPYRKQYAGINKDRSITFTGLDRVDSSVGYTPDNIVPCCWPCNWAKSDMSVSEFYTWVNRIVAFQNSLGTKVA